jgi:hypothetical protein
MNTHEATTIALAERALHCCYSGDWPARFGGIGALQILVPRLPTQSLARMAPVAAKAIFAVLRSLPEGANIHDIVGKVLEALLNRCMQAGQITGRQHSPSSQADLEAKQDGSPDIGCPEGFKSGHVEDEQLPVVLKHMLEINVQQLLSSRSSLTARALAFAGLEVCSWPIQASEVFLCVKQPTCLLQRRKLQQCVTHL